MSKFIVKSVRQLKLEDEIRKFNIEIRERLPKKKKIYKTIDVDKLKKIEKEKAEWKESFKYVMSQN